MPELPEVEVTKRGIEKALLNATIKDVFKSDKKLRYPLSDDLYKLKGAKITNIIRRAKYIIVYTTKGSLIIHLGMTGHFRVLEKGTERILHDHFDVTLDNGYIVRLNDTRRFGLVLFIDKNEDPLLHKLLNKLGPEPLSDDFNTEYLKEALKKKTVSIKQAIMDGEVVVGVGNIYASEVLFLSKINVETKARDVPLDKLELLVKNIKEILEKSIKSGGTTIKDFSGADGKPGYFVQNLFVYGHEGKECKICKNTIKAIIQGQRKTFFCPNCQK